MAARVSSTSWRLVAVGVFLTFAIAIATGWLVTTRRSDDLAENQRAVGELAQVLAEQTARTLQPVDLTLRLMQHQLANIGDPASGELAWWRSKAGFDHLTGLRKSLPQVDALVVVDANGQLLNYTRKYPIPQIDLTGREYFPYFKTHDDPGLLVSAPYQTSGDKIWSIALARRVNNAAGGFAGVAVAVVAIAYLEDFYRAVTPDDGAVTLLRRDGIMLGRYPTLAHQQGFKLPAEAPWYRVVEAGGGFYVTPGYLNHLERLVSVRLLRDFPLVIDISTSPEPVLARWRREAGWLIAGAALAVGVVVMLLWLFGRQVHRLMRSELSLAGRNAELEDGRSKFAAVLGNMSQGVTFFDEQLRLMVSNQRYAEIYHLTLEQTQVGTVLSDLLDWRVAANTFVAMTKDAYLARRAAATALNEPFDVADELTDGRIIAVHYQPMTDGGWVATHEDITERRQAEANMAFMARHDPLTGLPNRMLFRERLDEAIAGAGHGCIGALLCLDLDRFKIINDTLGHPVGDALLRAVAQRLLDTARTADTVARLGGDEFAIVQAGLKAPEHAAVLAERIVAAIQEPFEIDGSRIMVAASVGIALAADGRIPSETLLKNADIALYIAKSQGRGGTFRFFRPEMDLKERELRAIEMELRNALPAEAFELYYQPIVDLETEALTGFEALLRWNHPLRGRISPQDFIPIAEETGLIVAIGDWVLRAACREATLWPRHVDIAVNLSPAQFSGPHLFNSVQRALAESGLSPTRLILEITESVLMQQSDDRLAMLHRFRALGIRVALDDFGTGFSSLGYLRSFPFDKIKIDKSFIRDLDTNTDSRVIVAAVMGLARSFSMTTVAEGIETVAQLAALRDHGCTRGQGYLFSPPVPSDEILGFIGALTGSEALGHEVATETSPV
jgi:diguanylate cyclase (GGDEF)-like protein